MRSLRTLLSTLLFFLPARLLRLLLEARRRRRRVVVTLRLSGTLSEGSGGGGRLGAKPGPSTLGVLGALRDAAEDPSVEGVAVSIDRLGAGWAQLEELRGAVRALRDAGRSTFAYLERPGHAEWYLASAFEHVSIAPMATLDVVGLRAEVRFFKGLLSKLGIEPHLVTRGEYKSVVEPFTRESMSPAFRESLDGVLSAIHGALVSAVAGRLDVSTEDAQAVIDGGPFTAAEALERGLVDAALYPDRWRRAVKNRMGRGLGVEEPKDKTVEHDAAFLDAPTPDRSSGTRLRPLRLVRASSFLRPHRLLRRLERWASPAKRVAVVVAEGEIVDSRDSELPPGKIGARPYRALLKALRQDDSIGAVVLRVSSPGGSAGASDLLWRDLRRLSSVKPVVTSMGSVAASGGYYMAVAAHAIYADATTITGSIGVAAGKFDVSGLLDRVGIAQDVLSYGANAGMNSLSTGFTPAETERMSAHMDSFYDGFVARAAAGRKVAPEVLEPHARGRIWTGAQAAERGLVDRVGGVQEAIEDAARRAGLGARPDVVVVEPPRPGLLDRLQRMRVPGLGAIAGLPEALGLPTGLLARMPVDVTIR